MGTLKLHDQPPNKTLFWLDVPFAERSEVRALGGHWDGEKRRWWAEIRGDIAMDRFEKWLSSEDFDFGLEYDGSIEIDLIGLPWDCIRCATDATVLVGMTTAGRHVSSASLIRCDTELTLRLADRMLPDEIRRAWHVGKIQRRFSRTIRAAYLSNGCPECSLIFGNHPLYAEEVPYVLATQGAAGFVRMARVVVPRSWWDTTIADRYRC